MKLTINSKKLLHALNKVNSVVEKRNTIPILNNVSIHAVDNKLELQGTDLDISIKTIIDDDISLQQEGSLTVSAVMLSDIIKRLPDGDVTLEYKDDVLHIRSGRSRFKMQTLPVADFPAPQEQSTENGFSVNGNDLKEWLERVSYAASTEETRYFLCGVYMHSHDGIIRLVATDGHRLTIQDTTVIAAFQVGIIIPRKTVSEIIKMCDDEKVYIDFNDRIIKVQNTDTVLTSKLVDGTYPDYLRIIPTNHDKTMVVDAETIKKASDRVASINDQRTRAVRIQCRSDEVELSVNAANGDNANEIIDAKCDFELETGVNSRYLADAMSKFDGEVQLSFSEGTSPMIARQIGDDSYMTLIMPMRA